MPKDRLSFPFPEDCEVRISDDKYSMNIVSGGVIVSSQGSPDDDIPVDPACIVIDEKHIYLRRNWESWHTINTANKVFVKKLMESATCLIYDSVGGMTEEYRIPIYKLSNFTERLFKEDQLGEILSSMSKCKNNDKAGLKNQIMILDWMNFFHLRYLNGRKNGKWTFFLMFLKINTWWMWHFRPQMSRFFVMLLNRKIQWLPKRKSRICIISRMIC